MCVYDQCSSVIVNACNEQRVGTFRDPARDTIDCNLYSSMSCKPVEQVRHLVLTDGLLCMVSSSSKECVGFQLLACGQIRMCNIETPAGLAISDLRFSPSLISRIMLDICNQHQFTSKDRASACMTMYRDCRQVWHAYDWQTRMQHHTCTGECASCYGFQELQIVHIQYMRSFLSYPVPHMHMIEKQNMCSHVAVHSSGAPWQQLLLPAALPAPPSAPPLLTCLTPLQH